MIRGNCFGLFTCFMVLCFAKFFIFVKLIRNMIQPKGFYFVQFLKDSNPEVRGYSAILFSKLNVPDARDTLKELTGDSEKIEIYKDGNLKEVPISMLAEDAISRMIEHGKVFP